MSLTLRNPHSVLAVLETRPRDVSQITIPPKASTEAWEKVARLAKSHKIPILMESKRPVGPPTEESSRLGMASAVVKERASASLEDLFRDAKEKRDGKGLWLALDCLQDPHNVGAIFRAAAFFGVQGVLLTLERSAPLTATVYDVASGGMEYVPFCVQTNLQRAFEHAKEAGVWIVGSSEHAHDDFRTVQKDRPWLLVLGNEEKGMRRLTEESCDLVCRIPERGKVGSLNVSVASGILISHLSE